MLETLDIDDTGVVVDGCIPADIASMIKLCLFDDTPFPLCFCRAEFPSLLLCHAHTTHTCVLFCEETKRDKIEQKSTLFAAQP